jgi:hypothetical protein
MDANCVYFDVDDIHVIYDSDGEILFSGIGCPDVDLMEVHTTLRMSTVQFRDSPRLRDLMAFVDSKHRDMASEEDDTPPAELDLYISSDSDDDFVDTVVIRRVYREKASESKKRPREMCFDCTPTWKRSKHYAPEADDIRKYEEAIGASYDDVVGDEEDIEEVNDADYNVNVLLEQYERDGFVVSDDDIEYMTDSGGEPESVEDDIYWPYDDEDSD